MICPLCQTDFLLEECFRDRAATMELRKAILKCDSPGCPWEGKSEKYEVMITTISTYQHSSTLLVLIVTMHKLSSLIIIIMIPLTFRSM